MTPREHELSQQLFGGRQQSMGAMGAVKEAFLAIAPGLKDMIPEAKAELKQMGAHGAHELAAALFSGHAYVMYPRSKENEPSQEQAQDGETMQQDANIQHLERGGRSM
jgi:hypothetical protein